MKYLFWSFLGLLLATFYHRQNHYDEAWLAEQAYWLVHDGRVRSELFRGLNGWENQLFVFHKGFIYLSAAWQRAFGFSLVAGKSFSLVWAVLGGALLWGYLRQTLRQNNLDPRFVWLGLTLYVANGLLIEFSFVYRPEAMCVALGFASFWLLTNRRWSWAGALAGLATLAHLNGLCFVVAGAGLMGWQRQPLKQIAVFGVVAGLVASLYLLDIWQANGWAAFQHQLQHDPAMGHIRTWRDKLLATFRAAKFLRLSAELGLLWLGTYLLTRRPGAEASGNPAADRIGAGRAMGRYLLLHGATYLLLSRSNAVHYGLLFVPFVCGFVALRLADWQRTQPSTRAVWGWRVVLATYLLMGVYRAALLIRANLSSPGVALLNARMATLIGQPGQKVLAPLDFFYDQMGRYQIRCIDRYIGSFFNKLPNGNLSDQQLFQLAQREGFVAVITYNGKGPNAPLEDTRPFADSLAQFGPYKRIYQDRWNSLYVKSYLWNDPKMWSHMGDETP